MTTSTFRQSNRTHDSQQHPGSRSNPEITGTEARVSPAPLHQSLRGLKHPCRIEKRAENDTSTPVENCLELGESHKPDDGHAARNPGQKMGRVNRSLINFSRRHERRNSGLVPSLTVMRML